MNQGSDLIRGSSGDTINLHSLFTTPVGHQFHICRIVSLVEKRLLAAVATLRDRVGQTRNDKSCQSRHARSLSIASHRLNS
jgi:hypothetical protein